MKLYRFTVCVLLAAMSFLAVACSEEVIDNREHGYGYVQFKLYKQASYDAGNSVEQNSTRALTSRLEYLSDACKVKVTLSYNSTTIAQTLTLQSANAESAEYGMRSANLKLLVGSYKILNFRLYDTNDEELYIGTVGENNTFSITEGGLLVHDLTVNVTPRGSVRFSLKKDMSDFTDQPTQKNVERQYTFDEIKFVNITVAEVMPSGSTTNPTRFERLPATFSLHLDEDDEQSPEPGYQTSSILCDTLLSLPAGKYRVTRYETLDERKVTLEDCTAPKKCDFTIEDNHKSEVSVPVSLYEADAYIRDYYALYEIWKSLNGEKWYYVGENFTRGANWNFNKDVDLWGDQPGVELHSNGRVARIDISDFGFKGDLSPAIGQLTEIVELYLGTHNDANNIGYDPTLDASVSLLERNRNRLENHKSLLRKIYPASQMSEPCARALKENGISIAATSLYDTMSESEIFDMKSGSQREIVKHDTNHGTLCNGLKSIPAEIRNLTKLEYLYIANSEISSLPEELKYLEACTDIEIYNCPKLTKFPMAIAQMPSLISLNISNNKQWSSDDILAGIKALATGPSAEKIQILYARENSLAVMPKEMRNMKKMGLLDLAYNKIASIEAPMGKEFAPVQFYLDHNQITKFPHDAEPFCGMDDMESFSAKYNKLTEFPNIFSASSNFTIKSVDLSGNDIRSFEGENESDEAKKFKGIKVETLTLSQNYNLGKYPIALAKSNSLISYIILRACGITEIPKGSFTYKNSVDLMSLDLSYNRLEKLPHEMHAGNMPYLYGVDLSFNRFSEFPKEPLDCSGLTVLSVRSQRDAEGNRCLKEWPTGLFNHRGLRGFYIGSNDLRRIDDTISTLIYYLDISDNPNIIFDASDICYAWMNGAYILIYDKTQNILNCDYMLD